MDSGTWWIGYSSRGAATVVSLSVGEPRELAERHVLVGPGVTGQAEDPLGDDVALDLIGPATGAGAPLAEELLAPGLVEVLAAEERPRRPGDGHGQVGGGRRVARVGQLEHGRLGARQAVLAPRPLHPVAEETG